MFANVQPWKSLDAPETTHNPEHEPLSASAAVGLAFLWLELSTAPHGHPATGWPECFFFGQKSG